MEHRDARNRLGPSVAGLNHDSIIEAQVLTTSPARAPRAASRRGALLWEVDLARLGPALQAARATCAKCPCRKTQRFQIRAVSVGRWNVADVTAYVAAIVLAGAAAWFSICGMVVLFPAAGSAMSPS
jgi:hypothetical protein